MREGGREGRRKEGGRRREGHREGGRRRRGSDEGREERGREGDTYLYLLWKGRPEEGSEGGKVTFTVTNDYHVTCAAGAIELTVFSEHYKVELDVVDIQTQRIDRFGKYELPI